MKKSKKLLIILLALVLVSSLALSGCGQGTTSANSNKYLRIAKDVDIVSMDQHVATDELSFESIAATIEGLYTIDKGGNIIPAIALSDEVSDDGLTYTFKLREDAKWSNGDPVTANDFVYSWRRLADPNTASEYNFIMDVAGVKNAAKVTAGELLKEDLGVEAIDEHTLKVTLERPTPYFRSLTTFAPFYPLNEKFVTEKGEKYALEPENLLANGPYKMVEWNKGYGYKLDKNPDYYDAKNVKIDGLDFRIIKDSQTAALKFESNELDVVKLSSELVDKYKSQPSFNQISGGFTWYMSLYHNTEIFKNINARKAFSYAINKEHIANKILNDGSIAADFLVPNGLSTGPDGKDFRETAGTYSKYDKALALEYWNKAKSELGKDNFEIELLFDDSETVKKMSEFIQAELETNLPGLTVKLKAQPKKNRLELMREGSFEAGITRWGPDYADPLTYLELFLSDGGQNTPKYVSKEYDKLVNDSSRGELAGNPEGRWEAMKQAEKILLEQDAAIVPIFQSGSALLINPKVKGIEDHTVGTTFIYKNVEIGE
ncbi:peptide ABC transporter substrate-binding protein [Proteiniborus sp. MB09-C3]|uniref:peptide ABC transporter substrate-binding protein n=1 Tax=Proteiniborus sp. MB09-C3 TaxID=3050072 RepID=UPI00255639D1|nr:peptide ABC transporter substrate-binding protein [Proteiniborus sp. MB09-C3]WIV13813.1 peptide ABC transporter substrate-binding protein [Proteiniborus sp. MB09-C3]